MTDYFSGGVEVPVPELVPPLVPVPLEVPVPLLVPVPLEPALFAPLEEPDRFDPLDGLALLPLVPLLDEPALFAPELRSELVPLLLELVRVRLVSLELDPLLLGCVVGSLLVVPVLFVRPREFVPVSLLSQPMKAIPPNAKAAATKIP